MEECCETVVDVCESVSDVKCVCHTLNGCELAGLFLFIFILSGTKWQIETCLDSREGADKSKIVEY